MNSRQGKWMLTVAVVLMAMAGTATIVAAQDNPYYEACETFGGEYEERRTGCDPECDTTYICRFDDGSGRMCDDQGLCVAFGEASAAADSAEASDEESDSSDDSEAYEDCVAEASDACEEECSGKSGPQALQCARSCVEDRCGEPEYDSGDEYADDEGGSADSSEDCLSDCESKCSGPPRQRRACQASCESKCG